MPAVKERTSERGRRIRGESGVLRPIDQIERPPGGNGIEATGAWAYYIRPEGATIADALTLYPNGGIPDIDNARLRDRYGTNAEYYRQRQRSRGLEYVGQSLNEAAMKRLVEVLEANRNDEDLFLQEEIADAKDVAKTSDLPQVRNQAKRRIRQLERRLETIRQGFNPDELLAELNDIARAQQLAKVDPNVLRVMRSMIGEVNDKMAAQIAHFQSGRTSHEGAPTTKFTSSGSEQGEEFA